MNITIERAVTLREQAANIIRKMIVAGDLKAGNPVSVRQISQRLGVSASPVKEALRILEVEGLVYSLARKGFYVSESSAENMMQISKILASMEGIAAFFAAQNLQRRAPAGIQRCQSVPFAVQCPQRCAAVDIQLRKFCS